MNTAPKFDPYPPVREPNYPRWFLIGAVPVLGSSQLILMRSDSFLGTTCLSLSALLGIAVLWLLAFLLRVLVYCLNWHSANYYTKKAQQLQQDWWAHHRQKVALIEAVLVGGACSNPEQRQHLFSPDHQPPTPGSSPEGATIRLLQVFGDEVAERERQLAMLAGFTVAGTATGTARRAAVGLLLAGLPGDVASLCRTDDEVLSAMFDCPRSLNPGKESVAWIRSLNDCRERPSRPAFSVPAASPRRQDRRVSFRRGRLRCCGCSARKVACGFPEANGSTLKPNTS